MARRGSAALPHARPKIGGVAGVETLRDPLLDVHSTRSCGTRVAATTQSACTPKHVATRSQMYGTPTTTARQNRCSGPYHRLWHSTARQDQDHGCPVAEQVDEIA